jgi:hypothetical protein
MLLSAVAAVEATVEATATFSLPSKVIHSMTSQGETESGALRVKVNQSAAQGEAVREE